MYIFQWCLLDQMDIYSAPHSRSWLDGECDHGALTGPTNDPDRNELQYFIHGEPALEALRKLVLDKRWLESLSYYTKFRLVIVLHFLSTVCMCSICRHTGMLECFHIVMQHTVPNEWPSSKILYIWCITKYTGPYAEILKGGF